MFKNNLTFGYVLFVGIPLLILIGTLRAGANLSAPPAVSGEWTIDPAPGNCAGPPDMSIYQTGADVLIALNDPQKTTLAGKLEGGLIAAASTTTGCGGASRLEAALRGNPDTSLWRAGSRSTGATHAPRFRSVQ
ncbi:MAG: hypothetical protein ABSF54_05690 [Bryobacteraceae bacterium]|jgi:hypothetical protein